jgi:hypothetical protein
MPTSPTGLAVAGRASASGSASIASAARLGSSGRRRGSSARVMSSRSRDALEPGATPGGSCEDVALAELAGRSARGEVLVLGLVLVVDGVVVDGMALAGLAVTRATCRWSATCDSRWQPAAGSGRVDARSVRRPVRRERGTRPKPRRTRESSSFPLLGRPRPQRRRPRPSECNGGARASRLARPATCGPSQLGECREARAVTRSSSGRE